MKARNFVRKVIEMGNVTQVGVSKKMQRSPSYISSYIAGGNLPSIELAAEIADAANCDLIVYSRETGLEDIIEPPER